MLAALRHNFIYKLIAVFFAVVMHFYAAGHESAAPTHLLTLPLVARNLPHDLLLDEKTIPSVTLTLDGPPEEISRLTEANVTAWVDLSHARAGSTPLLTVHLNGLPGDVTTESDPRPVALMLQPRLRRQLAISADDIGIAPVNEAFTALAVAPREAVIMGTREAVDSVIRVVAQADPAQTPGAVDDDYPLVALDKSGSPVADVTVTPPTAHVRMNLARALARKTLIVSANVVGTLPAPYRFGNIETAPATVTAEGRPEKLALIGTLTTAPIDVSGAKADIVRRVGPIVPAGVTLSPRGPITVTVHVIAPPAPPVLAPVQPTRPQ